MTCRAHVAPDWAWDAVAVYLTDQFGPNGARRIAAPVTLEFRDLSGADEATVQPPTLRLPETVARALCDALCAHFGGTSDTVTARRDLQALWGRYDKAVDALTGIATRIGGDGRG